MTLFPVLCGAKKAVTSLSKKVSPLAPISGEDGGFELSDAIATIAEACQYRLEIDQEVDVDSCVAAEVLTEGEETGCCTGRLNTAFIERVHLTVRHGVAALACRTWATSQQAPHLLAHLEWWRAYYHFVHPHASLQVALLQPRERGGKFLAQRYRRRTPAMAAEEPTGAGLCGKRCAIPCRRCHASQGERERSEKTPREMAVGGFDEGESRYRRMDLQDEVLYWTAE